MPAATRILAAVVAMLGALVGMTGVPAQERAAETPAERQVTVTQRVYDKAQLLAAPAPTGEVFRGRAIWLQRCAYCHDGVGQPSYNTMGPWIGAPTIELYKEPAFRAIVAGGTARMPGFKYALTDKQVGELIAFVKTVPASQKPTAEQLAGRPPAGASGD
jgi:mono/diheme cytochrome c family protein